MDDKDVIDRANRASKLLTDPLLAEAFEGVRKALFNQIENCPIQDRDALHEWRVMLKLLRDVKANLETAIKDGKLVAFRAREAEERKGFARWIGR